MKILIVCLGNICRSPMAEVILKQVVLEKKLPWTIESAGTNRYHKGGPADERAVRVCKKRGVDLSQHIARRFKTKDFDLYDLIYIMAPDVRDEMSEFVTDQKQWDKVKYFNDDRSQTVPDPWYGDESDFEACFSQIELLARKIADTL